MSKKRACISQFLGVRESGSCGYCKGKTKGDKQTIAGFIHNCPCDVYEELLERQWRRCGNYYYQPQNFVTCCPQYTIRLDCTKFKPNKKHRKVFRKVDKFLGKFLVVPKKQKEKKSRTKKVYKKFPELNKLFLNIIVNCMKKDNFPTLKLEDFNVDCRYNFKRKSLKDADLALNVAMMISGKIKKITGKIITSQFIGGEILKEYGIGNYNNLKLIEKISLDKNGFLMIHLTNKIGLSENPNPQIPKQQKKKKVKKIKKLKDAMEIDNDISIASNDIVEINSDDILLTIDKAEFKKEEFLIYKKYQMEIHKDEEEDITEDGYTSFLCDSTLIMEKGPFKGMGTYHIQYRLKNSNKLIAVSVIDVLPKGLSSVYFFYDTSYSHLVLGVYSALREIELIAKENLKFPNFKYYYMGFYIHSCQKMKYKAQFKPSELVCNESWKWIDIEKCKTLLDKNKYARFSDKSVKIPENFIYDNTLIFFQGSLIPLLMFKNFAIPLTKKCVEKMKLFHYSMGKRSKEIAFYVDPEKDIVGDVMF